MENRSDRPRVLVIAGFDPCAGAGILADIKTLEANGVYGYAACTAMTWQNEHRIERIQWYSLPEILDQIDCCFGSASFDVAKIGIVRSIGMMERIVMHLRKHNPSVRIVWDPVIRASSGVDFWEAVDASGFERLAEQCALVTPNWEEMGWLYPGQDIPAVCRKLSMGTSIYLKGGHNPSHPGRDYCWSDGEVEVLEAAVGSVYPKHGSGCVMASALAANLASGYSLSEAASRAKGYIESFLTSNQSLLGWHQV